MKRQLKYVEIGSWFDLEKNYESYQLLRFDNDKAICKNLYTKEIEYLDLNEICIRIF